MPRVLVIEADATLRSALVQALAQGGHEVESASSAQGGIALARASIPDVVLFDPALPDMARLDVCRALAGVSGGRATLLVLSGAADEADRVSAFEAGVDDYMLKPPSMRELVLRVRALSRRGGSAPPPVERISLGTLAIDRAARRVDVDGATIDLTRREFDLLLTLAEHAGRVRTRDALVSLVWGEATDSGRVVDTTIKRLRRKIGVRGPSIKTVRGVGYKIEAE